ncbi:MAG: DNA polymerase III subunit gamma/tau [Proteobacteria bacterium]|nr:DNA polymerase III subunit gamma/tau [Pseudomonadota bacterium]
MTHQAIARKWRPRIFEEISGQTHVTKTLQNAIRLGRIHHAFLMTGARGVGKTSAARILARALNCEKGPAPNPCNECSACTQMLAGTFSDLIEIDAASHNSVDDIRDLVEKVRYTPQSGRYKVYIIDEVHMVSKQGFNALLKTLEEPPGHVIFVLATTDPQQLLDTVISRCQRFDFKMIAVRVIFDRLKQVSEAEGVTVPDSSLMTIAREGAGSMRDAQSLLDQVLSFSSGSVSEEEVAEILGFIDRSILYDVLQFALEGDAGSALEQLSKVATFGYDVRSFGNHLLEAVRNVAMVRQVRDGARLLDLPDGEVTRLSQMAQGRDPDRLHRQFDVLAEAVDAITRSEQPMLLLEMAVAKMAAVRDFAPVQSLVDRLEALERKLRKGGFTATPSASAPSASAAPPKERFVPPPLPKKRERTPPPPKPTPKPVQAAPPPPKPAPVAKPEPTPAPPVQAAPAPTPKPTPPPAPAGPALAGDDFAGPPPMWDDEPGDSAPAVEAAPPPPPKPVAPPKPVEPVAPAQAAGGAVLGQLLNYKRGGAPAARTTRSATATATAEPAVPAPAPKPSPAAEPVPRPVTTQDPPESAPPRAAAPPPKASKPTPPPPAAAAPPARKPARPRHARSADKGPEPEFDESRADPAGSERCDATRWRRFVRSLADRTDLGPSTAAFARSGFLGADGATISIGFGTEIAVRQMESLANTPGLMETVRAEFGEDTQLAWSLDVEDRRGRSLQDELLLLKRNKEAEVDAASRNDSAVQRVLSLFPGSEIAEVTLPDNLEFDDVR